MLMATDLFSIISKNRKKLIAILQGQPSRARRPESALSISWYLHCQQFSSGHRIPIFRQIRVQERREKFSSSQMVCHSSKSLVLGFGESKRRKFHQSTFVLAILYDRHLTIVQLDPIASCLSWQTDHEHQEM